MRAAALRHSFITVKKPVLTKDGYGSEVEDWHVLYPAIRASVTAQIGDRQIGTYEISPVISYEVTLRRNYKKDLTHLCVVVYNNREYRINSIEDAKDNNNIILNISLINE